jgi:K+ transporter
LDERLVETLARAWRWPQLMDGDVYTSITEMARGTAVFLTGNPYTVPRALLHNLKAQ